MAYEKALSLITGGGKTYTVEHEGLDSIIKTTPDEMQAGAIVTEASPFAAGEYMAYFVVRKYTDNDSKPAIDMLTAASNSAKEYKTRLATFTYDEAKGGYVASLA